MKKSANYARRVAQGLAAGMSLAAAQAWAAVPANVSTAITDGGVDASTVAGLVLVAIVGIFAFKLMRKGL